MPRRGRHRTRLPLRLLAAVVALLLGGTGVLLAGSALADQSPGETLASVIGSDDGSSSDSQDSDDGSDDSSDQQDGDSDEGSEDGSDQGSDQGSDEDSDEKGSDKGRDEKGRDENGDGQDDGQQHDEAENAKGEKEVEFAGRDKIAKAGDDEYVDITEVAADGGRGDGGVFGGGSYSVDCGVSDHNNSDNYMAAPGKRNGAQHVHDYVGNDSTDNASDHGALEQAGTSCGNGDKSAFFWPVLRDLNGTGPDVGEDGGSLDGNTGSIVKPESADLRFHGHPGQETEPLPQGLMMITGNAKAKVQDGKNANAKYTCTGFTDRVTEKYPICPSGSKLVRMLDYPSCWDGANLESKDFRSHMSFPDGQGRCEDGKTPVPQLRITLTYDQPAGRAFAIDSFPDNQHDPSTDHSDYENVASEKQNEAGAACINAGDRCDG